MATTYSLTSSRFPNGTTVYANAVGLNDPPVSALVVLGTAEFTGLRELQEYVAHATIGTPDVDGNGVTHEQVTFFTDGGFAGEVEPPTTLVGFCQWDDAEEEWTFDGEPITERPDFAGKLMWFGGGASADPTPDGLGYTDAGDVWFPSEAVV